MTHFPEDLRPATHLPNLNFSSETDDYRWIEEGMLRERYGVGNTDAENMLAELEAAEKCIRNEEFLLDLLFCWAEFDEFDYIDQEGFLEPYNYESRAKEVDSYVKKLQAERGRELIMELIFAVETFKEVSHVYRKVLSAEVRAGIASGWYLSIRHNRRDASWLSPEESSRRVLDMVSDLNRVLSRKVEASFKGTQRLVVLSRPANWHGNLADVAHSVFHVKTLRNQHMLLLPVALKSFLEQAGYLTLRSAALEPDPALVETAAGLWDEGFEKNYGSFKQLVETARGLI